MDDQRLTDALRERAAADARAFRRKYPENEPNEKWLDNSFTAALPLAASDAAADVDTAAHPDLFEIYKAEVSRSLGIVGRIRPDSEADRHDGGQMPTRGEG